MKFNYEIPRYYFSIFILLKIPMKLIGLLLLSLAILLTMGASAREYYKILGVS
jgi:hypothetical protein